MSDMGLDFDKRIVDQLMKAISHYMTDAVDKVKTSAHMQLEEYMVRIRREAQDQLRADMQSYIRATFLGASITKDSNGGTTMVFPSLIPDVNEPK